MAEKKSLANLLEDLYGSELKSYNDYRSDFELLPYDQPYTKGVCFGMSVECKRWRKMIYKILNVYYRGECDE